MQIPGLFITGTDTGVGKTYIAAAIVQLLAAKGCRVGAYKPAASGCETNDSGARVWEDVEALYAALNGKFPRERICPQTFSAPLAPPVAAVHEDRALDAKLLRDGARWWETQVDFLIVEGAGGLLSPLSDADSNADLAHDLNLPLLIVARLGLGTINHTLLTMEAAQCRGLSIAGVVLSESTPSASDLASESNEAQLKQRCPVPILGVFRHAPQTSLLSNPEFSEIDWKQLGM